MDLHPLYPYDVQMKHLQYTFTLFFDILSKMIILTQGY